MVSEKYKLYNGNPKFKFYKTLLSLDLLPLTHIGLLLFPVFKCISTMKYCTLFCLFADISYFIFIHGTFNNKESLIVRNCKMFQKGMNKVK